MQHTLIWKTWIVSFGVEYLVMLFSIGRVSPCCGEGDYHTLPGKTIYTDLFGGYGKSCSIVS